MEQVLEQQKKIKCTLRDFAAEKRKLKWWEKVLNILYPKACCFCGETLNYDENRDFCQKCLDKTTVISGHICEKCGYPLSDVYLGNLCGRCEKYQLYFDKNITMFQYGRNVRAGIMTFKFTKDGFVNGDIFGKLMAVYINKNYSELRADCVVPMPISFVRLKDRGYNQSLFLARQVAISLDLPVFDGNLTKTRDNEKQSLLDFEQRMQNVKGTYVVKKPDVFKDKVVLLVDDVLTSGASLNEAAKMLKQAGAVVVYTMSMAMTVN